MSAKARRGGKQVLFSGRHVRLMSHDGWEYAERIGATGVVAIVAVADGRLILTEQYRRPVDARVIDLPAGLAGDLPGEPDESLAVAARRELLEETGYEAAEMTWLTTGPPTAGLATEMVTLFLATGARRVGDGGGDESEDIIVHAPPLADIEDWFSQRIAEGLLVDPKVYAGLYFVDRHHN